MKDGDSKNGEYRAEVKDNKPGQIIYTYQMKLPRVKNAQDAVRQGHNALIDPIDMLIKRSVVIGLVRCIREMCRQGRSLTAVISEFSCPKECAKKETGEAGIGEDDGGWKKRDE